MSENVTIAVGGQGRRMPSVSEIRTDNASGTDDWVPESDYLTGVKFISENGTYYAKDDGVQSWSKVTVNVPGAAAGMTIPTIADDYGIMVPTGEMGDCMPTPPEGLIPDDWEDPEIGFDIDGIDGVPSIVGLDPITGDKVVIGIDPDGNKIEETLPSSISIEHNPFKMTYRDGEHISLSGIRVYAKKKDGTIWTSREYPDGAIPLRELTYTPSKADISGIEYTSYTIDVEYLHGYTVEMLPIRFLPGSFSFYNTSHEKLYEVSGAEFGCAFNDFVSAYSRSGGQVTVNETNLISGKKRVFVHTLNGPYYTHKNSTAYYEYPVSSGRYPDVSQLPTNRPARNNSGDPATAYYDGTLVSEGGEQDINIGWARPVDGKALSTILTVTVKSSSSNNDGSGGGAQSGGGSGGGGGGAY